MNFTAITPRDLGYMPQNARPIMCADTKGIMAVDEEGIPQAICVLDSWSFNSCQIHIWIENAFVLKHGFAEEVFNYIFNTCGRNVVIGVTPDNNVKALKFIKHIGLEEVCRIKDGYAEGVDYIITEIRRENCRYI